MPYVPISGISRQNLLEIAERRWAVVGQSRPDLAPALELQRRLLGIVIDISDALEAGRLPRLSLPPKYVAAKLARGVPLLAGEPIPIPLPLLKPAIGRLSDALSDGGAGEAAAHIRQAVDDGSIEAGSFLGASLARNQTAIRTGATHRGLAPDLLWLVGELAVSPYVHLLQQRHLAQPTDADLRAAADAWSGGYCPACGSWPAVAEVVGGHRTLRCSFCAAAWELNAYACIYCGESGESFVTAAPDDERKDRRLELCHHCGGYLKTIDVAELSPFPLLSISDIETTDLDVAAMEHRFARPALKEFAKR
ncbi:MAG TPA: formate dehydrogenase accessory protein FdhE [Vicinamibacterales bacterium]|nr:formate dehydrogenase accessory protein FdhE [Vicinamibacterales bacterium]